MKISKKSFFSFIIISFFFSLILVPGGLNTTLNAPAQVMAQADSLKDQFAMEDVAPIFGGEPHVKDIRVTILKFIRLGLSFLSLIFLVLILMSGFKWMTSGGNEQKIKDAQKNLLSAVIGLVIILAAWTIATYFLRVLTRVIGGYVDYGVF